MINGYMKSDAAKSTRMQLAPRDRLLVGIVRGILFALVRMIEWTCKLEYRGVDRIEAALATGRPVIVAAWHGSMVSLMVARLGIQMPRLLMMVSRSKDGEFASRIIELFGVDTVRGSSSRGGTQAILELRRRIRPGANPWPTLGIHALDGPRGPRHKVKPGIVQIAQKTNALVIPLAIASSRQHEFKKAWDRHAIPLPGSRIVLEFDEPIDFCEANSEDAAETSKEQYELGTELIETRLRALAQDDPILRREYED